VIVAKPVASAEPVEPAEPAEPAEPGPAEPAEPAEAGEPAAGGRGRRLPRLLPGLLVIALAAASLLLWAGSRSANAAAATRDDVLAAARQEAVNLTSQDYRTVDADLRRMADGATGQLRDDLDQRSTAAKQVVVKNKAVARGVVVEAGLVLLHDGSATALVAVDSTVTSGGTASASHRYRFQLDLARVGDRWLVSNLTAVGLTS
jgi:Mce-associated membrane protein